MEIFHPLDQPTNLIQCVQWLRAKHRQKKIIILRIAVTTENLFRKKIIRKISYREDNLEEDNNKEDRKKVYTNKEDKKK